MVVKGDHAKTLDDAVHGVIDMFENMNELSKQQSAGIKSFTSGSDT